MQANKKKILPNIDQKLPKLETINPNEEIIKKIHPSICVFLLLINVN